jgi:hypothetical protein
MRIMNTEVKIIKLRIEENPDALPLNDIYLVNMINKNYIIKID